MVCGDGNLTFLIDERRCVKNEELFHGNLLYNEFNRNPAYIISDCSFAITANEEPSGYRLALNIAHQSHTEVVTALTFTSSNSLTNAVVVARMNQTVSNCQIATLEVYRGRKQSTVIHHDGFSLRNSRTIEVVQMM